MVLVTILCHRNKIDIKQSFVLTVTLLNSPIKQYEAYLEMLKINIDNLKSVLDRNHSDFQIECCACLKKNTPIVD